MTSSPKRAFLVALLPFMGGVVAMSAIPFMNSGHLVYTPDDAYIHLSLAENIARGRYGVNLGESSRSACSQGRHLIRHSDSVHRIGGSPVSAGPGGRDRGLSELRGTAMAPFLGDAGAEDSQGRRPDPSPARPGGQVQ
jgi:hypothetical protein